MIYHRIQLFWILTIVLLNFPEINSYNSQRHEGSHMPTTPINSQSKSNSHDPDCLENQGDDKSDQMHASRNIDPVINTGIFKTEDFHNSDLNLRNFQPIASTFSQVKPSYTQNTQTFIHDYPDYEYTYTTSYKQFPTHNIFVNQADQQQYLFHNGEHFQQNNPTSHESFGNSAGSQSGLIFKVQRGPNGKLNAVINEGGGTDVSINPGNYPSISTNPSRRSTVATVTTTKPTRPTQHQTHGGPDIVFPNDDYVPVNHHHQKKMIPKCAKEGDLFCTEVENYPTARVQQALLAKIDQYKNLFGDDVIVPNFSERIDTPGEMTLCPSSEKVIYPQAGLNKDNKWNFIINHQNFSQGMRIEECINHGVACEMADVFPNGYTSECRQHYVHRRLVSLNEDGEVVRELYKIPACCKCFLKQTERVRRSTNMTPAIMTNSSNIRNIN